MDLATELDHPSSRLLNLDDTIQLIILDAIIDDCEDVNNRWDGRSPKLSLSRYAAVSKLWQNHVEKKTFSRLALSNEHLSRFDSMFSSFPARRTYLRHIELRISWADTWWAHTADDDDQLSTISKLLSSLSNWRAPDDLEDTKDDDTALKYPGLTLEIRSWAGIWANGEVMVDTYTTPQGRPGRIIRQAATAFGSSYDRTAPRFETTRSPWLPCSGNVTVVRTLLLRRQTRQSLGPQLVSSILSHLPKCDNLIYEPWLHVRQHIQRRIFLGLGRDLDKEYAHLLAYLPPNIKSVTLFEDFDPYLDRDNLAVSRNPSQAITSKFSYINGPPPMPSQAVASALAQGSHHLTNLSASYLIEASDFFTSMEASQGPAGSIFHSPIWSSLETVTLTSHLLADNTQQARVKDLIISAAAAARLMPRLQLLELWYAVAAGASAGAAFIYTRNASIPEIAWRGTWELDLGTDIIEVWKKVNGLFEPYVKVEVLDNRYNALFKSHARAAQVLGLRGEVAHPASVEEILWENGDKTW